ncbi:hypothetical protein AKJ48_03665 [candidate division MSBL1 archaeon SCGC-AAA261O19]|uniref:Ribbon-helix-helix protein CopG domain-containing protein n=1 Tax=candidate division MSBL1 archaeon SCGC-AAA261O19 TaxID=1698277 RepID=A0A133VBC9_9EURY|nr:hypothetical protein AKJ48_03665 [candidate division MSBL1 archaeon SCGC-AAA261O19]
MKTTSFRLNEKELERIQELAERESKEKSEVMRRLIDSGWEYLMIKRYARGKISLGRLAKELDLSITETLDILSELGVKAQIRREDIQQGYETLKAEY